MYNRKVTTVKWETPHPELHKSKYLVLTGSPLMNQLISAAGLELADVQLTSTLSPREYLSLPPVINGPFFGRTRKKK